MLTQIYPIQFFINHNRNVLVKTTTSTTYPLNICLICNITTVLISLQAPPISYYVMNTLVNTEDPNSSLIYDITVLISLQAPPLSYYVTACNKRATERYGATPLHSSFLTPVSVLYVIWADLSQASARLRQSTTLYYIRLAIRDKLNDQDSHNVEIYAHVW